MFKLISFIWTLLAVSTFAENSNQKVDMCALQSKVNNVLSRFTTEGQTTVRQILLDIQHEFSDVLQKEYSKIKSKNATTLSQIQAAEGDKFTSFLNAIGFNNASAFSGAQVDWCQIQTDALGSYNQMSAPSQAQIMLIAKSAMQDAKSDFFDIPRKVAIKDKALIDKLVRTESMENLMALARVFANSMGSF